MKDSKEYLEKKAKFERLITLYGRQTVKEVLQDNTITIEKLHLAKSNKQDGTIRKIMILAKERSIPIVMHEKATLARISKNAKQDQGVAVDIYAKSYQDAKTLCNL